MNHQTTAILNKIREKCTDSLKLKGCTEHWNTPEKQDCYSCARTEWGTVHLEHLLRTIEKHESIVGGNAMPYVVIGAKLWFHRKGPFIDLTLTVEQNLEANEALREWLYSLICKV